LLDNQGWSPSKDVDQTLAFDTSTHSGPRRSPRRHTASQSFDLSQHASFGNDESTSKGSAAASRRAAFVPAHLLPQSDAATEFDFGSLPPSSPPQLPSEAFPTPSDFDGITPSAAGDDVDERERPSTSGGGASPLTIEAVAEKVATEPNEDARKAMLALLQSLGTSDAGMDGGSIGTGKDAVQLDRSTVNKLLSLISANPASTASASASTAAVAPFATGSHSHSHGMTTSASTSTIVPNKASPQRTDNDQPDLSHLDLFNSFESEGFDDDGHHLHGGQVGNLYENLFGGGGGF
jgi:hypothetical protein